MRSLVGEQIGVSQLRGLEAPSGLVPGRPSDISAIKPLTAQSILSKIPRRPPITEAPSRLQPAPREQPSLLVPADPAPSIVSPLRDRPSLLQPF